jgi:FtsH ternary system domain X3
MRVKVRFRFNSVTGEVEAFDVDDMREGPRVADHDARHERAAADVARIVEANALIEEVAPGTEPVTTITTRAAPETEQRTRETNRSHE